MFACAHAHGWSRCAATESAAGHNHSPTSPGTGQDPWPRHNTKPNPTMKRDARFCAHARLELSLGRGAGEGLEGSTGGSLPHEARVCQRARLQQLLDLLHEGLVHHLEARARRLRHEDTGTREGTQGGQVRPGHSLRLAASSEKKEKRALFSPKMRFGVCVI